ncbi:hypothetical protein EVJ27_11845 [Exiguobacterium sp. SH3S2]|uniref:hypothetical protein n=1 Tax=unclassified Exiguobacterium TaxID=2644629 RepID=UPI00103FEF92|nr:MULTISPECIES: hypothetical protein [unclassified Exiguobacterium]TCI42930.1 hypothetical protein EVJ28_11865 [Exiguobacterium sp. SH3S3]TCI56142.1 hypothetical protein EVJ30_04445 [Exiguobacterium sp. SH5S13]TCI58683.1 hypothetical protein EVJ27_11845 [Exiguobacterium sp. SH3S2]TCI61724.1 hypothetical protein EVJ26_09180 [Exiguobacterium sp. SH3S1]
MDQPTRIEQETAWKKQQTRVGYIFLSVVVLAIVLSFFGKQLWLIIPLTVVGVRMLMLDVQKYQMRRARLVDFATRKVLRRHLVYDIVSSIGLLILVSGLLVFNQDDLYWAFGVFIWGTLTETVSRRLNQHDPILRSLEAEEVT